MLLIELDGLQDGMDDAAEQIAALCRAQGALDVRVARDEAERADLWRGRQGSFPSITSLAPNYLSLGTVPRTQLPEMLRRVAALAADRGLGVLPLHAATAICTPAFFTTEPTLRRNAKPKASLEVLRICARLGGTISGEHGIGVEKLEAMPLVFSDDDLQAQWFVKDVFDPQGLCNPGKLLPLPWGGSCLTCRRTRGRSGQGYRIRWSTS